MNLTSFYQQLAASRERITDLYESVNTQSTLLLPDLLPEVFKELGVASEELQVASEEVYQQREELANLCATLKAERQCYQELFHLHSDSYFVTDPQGNIQQINLAAITLLNVSYDKLVQNKPFVIFVASEDRQRFYLKLTDLLKQSNTASEQAWVICLQPRNSEKVSVAITVGVVRDRQGHPTTLHWVLRQLGDLDHSQPQTFAKPLRTATPERPLHRFSKGDLIPLPGQSLWQVRQGLVKLTTLSEQGEEIIVGLAGPSMPFSSGLSGLQTYQARALSEVQLVNIPLEELNSSGRLAQELVPHLNQRLRQSEILLSILGQRHVADRLRLLLSLLKQEIGQSVPGGTRLSVRLIHEDLANLCCTTRVTITRLLNQMKQQGEITFDAKRHLVLKEDHFQVSFDLNSARN